MPDWQTILALTIVAIAAALFLRHILSMLGQSSHQTGCGACSHGKSDRKELIQLGTDRKKEH